VCLIVCLSVRLFASPAPKTCLSCTSKFEQPFAARLSVCLSVCPSLRLCAARLSHCVTVCISQAALPSVPLSLSIISDFLCPLTLAFFPGFLQQKGVSCSDTHFVVIRQFGSTRQAWREQHGHAHTQCITAQCVPGGGTLWHHGGRVRGGGGDSEEMTVHNHIDRVCVCVCVEFRPSLQTTRVVHPLKKDVLSLTETHVYS